MPGRMQLRLSPVRRTGALESISGPLLFVRTKTPVMYGEYVKIRGSDGEIRRGQVLEATEDMAVVQVFEGTSGIDIGSTVAEFTGELLRLPVSSDMIGRIFNGRGEPIDNRPDIVADEILDIHGSPMNPATREYPREPIQTGISAIDGMNTLIRGQKLPIFSAHGLPHNMIAAQIIRQARIRNENEEFLLVFGGLGLTADEASFFRESFRRQGALSRVIMFLNLAEDPAIERLVTPRMVLTTAEYFAFEHDYHVLVILTDMTNYCEALREVSAARKEIPGRQGYPGYMYTDLASIYERAGRIKGRKGSVTQIPILTMPNDDITHPIPDLTGYITEGQIIIDRTLHRRGIYPPINVLSSLSRLMKEGIGKGYTREDHAELSNSLYAAYAEGINTRELASIIGEDALTDIEQLYLDFAEQFEKKFVGQGPYTDRSFEETLDLGWELLAMLPESELIRASKETLEKYWRGRREKWLEEHQEITSGEEKEEKFQ